MKILFEDKYILAAEKPQGMPSQADKTGDPDLLSELEAYAGKPLGLLHRLDRPVGGVMLFAKDKKAEAILAKDLQEMEMTWSETLPILAHWRSMASGDYVCALEPTNSYIMGRKFERENGSLPKLQAFETLKTQVTFHFETI